MSTHRYTVVLERNEDGGYTITVPALRGCVTQGDNIADALANAKEAIECYLESLIMDGLPFPPDVKEAQLSLDSTDEALIFKVVAEPELELATTHQTQCTTMEKA